jgi:hypothetical protein
MFGADDVRIENVSDATIIKPTLKLSLLPFSKHTPGKGEEIGGEISRMYLLS